MIANPTSMIEQACRALFAEGQVTELRVIGIGQRDHTASGWFNDLTKLAEAAAGMERQNPAGIYVTLNPLHEGCLARANNRMRDRAKPTSSDGDVIARHWLPIDVDPVIPAGISATKAEMEAALEVALRMDEWLRKELEWPVGLKASSGNGIHELMRILLANDDESRQLVRNILEKLDDKFTTKHAKIDPVNHNASRIWKCYGTVARKGEHTEERPHRRSTLWPNGDGKVPGFGEVEVVSVEKLRLLAKPATATTPRRNRQKFDIDEWVAKHQLPVTRKESWGGGTRWILEHCIFDESHVGTSAALCQTAEGVLAYKCQHNSCRDRQWSDVRALYEPDHEKPAADKPVVPSKPKSQPAFDPWEQALKMIDQEYTDADTGQVILRRHREVYYKYCSHTRRYVPQSEDTIKVATTRWLGGRIDNLSVPKCAIVRQCLASHVTVPSEVDPPFVSHLDPTSGCVTADSRRYNRISMRNGILDVDGLVEGLPLEKCLSSHTADWFCLTSLPFDCPITEEQAKCDKWMKFLNEIFEGDEARIALLQEAFGYCFFDDNALETFFIFAGEGKNGKSRVLGILQAVLGEDNVASLSIEQLSDRFMLQSLYGKWANLCADLNEVERVQEGLLKALVSGDSVTSDRKYLSPISFTSRAKMFFSANRLPRFVDTSLGIWRRMVVIPFDFVVPDERVDTRLHNKLITELPGILWWSMQGLVRLAKTRRFTEPVLCQRALLDYRRRCFPILQFLDECTELCEDACTSAYSLWRCYRGWSLSCGLTKTKPVHAFLEDVKSFRPDVELERSGSINRREVRGIVLKTSTIEFESSGSADLYTGGYVK